MTTLRADPPSTPIREGAGLAWSGVAIDVVLAVAVAAFRYAHATVGQRHAEGVAPTVAIGVLFAAPALLAAIGLRTSRPVLVGSAAIACGPLMILSIAAFPIVVPAALFAVSYARASRRAAPARTKTMIAGGLFVVVHVVAIGVWLIGWGSFTYEFPGGSEGGAYVLPVHAVVTILVVGVNVAVAALLARAREDPEPA